MKVTKYAHACMILEENGQRMVIDPGMLTELPADLSNIVAVLVTHVHGDHVTAENIRKIVVTNPEVVLLAGPETMAELNAVTCKKEEISADCEKAYGNFKLRLQYGDHAVIYGQVPCMNIRVTVNDKLYYPGDSLVPPPGAVKAVAVPLNAPWSKAGEVIEFTKACDAQIFFPVHDGIINETGQGFYNNWVSKFVTEAGKTYAILKTGESLDI